MITGAFPHPSNLPNGRESNHNNKVLLLRHYRHTKNYEHLYPSGARGQKRRYSSLQLISNTSHNHQNNYFCAERCKCFVRGATSAAQSSRNLCPRDALWKIMLGPLLPHAEGILDLTTSHNCENRGTLLFLLLSRPLLGCWRAPETKDRSYEWIKGRI